MNTNVKINVPEYRADQLTYSIDKPMASNENFKIFSGTCETLGNVSIISLHNYKRHREHFYHLLNNVNVFSNLKLTYLAKLLGYAIEDTKFNLIFERLECTLDSRLKTQSVGDHEKFSIALDMMELILALHDSKFKVREFKPNSIFLSSAGSVKIIFPLDNINLFKEEINEEDEIIENLMHPEENLIRYTPPEKLLEPPMDGPFNDIWMLGCFLIELFSKSPVWEGYTENEIIKKLKSLAVPKIPNEIPQYNWGLICECLNPFYKARHSIKDLMIRFFFLIKKLGLEDLIRRMGNMPSLIEFLPNETFDESQIAGELTNDYQVKRCDLHHKNLIDSFCVRCNDLVCAKCQTSKPHVDHPEEIKEIKVYLDESTQQIEVFLGKFSKFVDESSRNFPIDDTIREYIAKQKNIIDVLYDDHKKFVCVQFEAFHNKIEQLKELELSNLKNFRDFFAKKLEDFEATVNDLVEERKHIEEQLQEKLNDLKNFTAHDSFRKIDILKNIVNDKEDLKEHKFSIMNKFKDYQKQIGTSDKIKRYFQRSVLNLKENKAYQLVKVVEKLYLQLENTYRKINLEDYMNAIIIDLDNYALLNSRNYLPTSVKSILIGCFKSKKVLSYSIPENKLEIITADFSKTNYDMFLNFSRSININGVLFVNGGWDENKKISLKTHLSFIPMSPYYSTECTDMIYGHSAHSLLYVPPTYIYVISGSGTAKCEKYDINAQVWTEIPEVNFHRQNTSLFYHNEQYLYAFGGLCYDEQLSDFIFVETVERLDIGFGQVEGAMKWEIVPTVKARDNVNISKSVMTVVPIHPNRILLVGGMLKEQSYSEDVILFDLEKSEFSLCDDVKLEKQTCFPSKFFLFQGDYAYQFDNEGDIHEFNVKECSFKLVNAHKANAA